MSRIEKPEGIRIRKQLYLLVEKYQPITAYDLAKLLILDARGEEAPHTISCLSLPEDVLHSEVMSKNVQVGRHLVIMKDAGLVTFKEVPSSAPKEKKLWSLIE